MACPECQRLLDELAAVKALVDRIRELPTRDFQGASMPLQEAIATLLNYRSAVKAENERGKGGGTT